MSRPPLVTLTTDFGTRDPYVAAMKGVIASICPHCAVLDLTHDIGPQDVMEAAMFVAESCRYFPDDSIHVVVVDPGVGSARRAVAARAGGQMFVCPDNGVLSCFLEEHPAVESRAIVERNFMRETISHTFHGRDIFAPAAAHLARGVPMERLGPPVHDLVRLDNPRVRHEEGRLIGRVMKVDRFGNVITNIRAGDLQDWRNVSIRAGTVVLTGLKQTYADVEQDALLALIGSTNRLEISVRGGHAAHRLGLDVGAEIEVQERHEHDRD